MDRRPPQMSDLGPDHLWNHQHPGPQMNFADGSSMLPSHSIAPRNPTVVPYANTAMGIGHIPLPNYCYGSMNYMASSMKSSYDSYACPPSSSNLNQLPSYYVQNEPCYNQVMLGDATAISNPQQNYGRATYKRKIPSVSDAERGTLSGYYGAGSSSLPSQSGYLEPKPAAGHEYWTMDPASTERCYSGNELFSSVDTSQRNVRSRHGNGLHIEMTSTGVHSSNYMPHHFPSVVNAVNPTASMQWNNNSVAPHHHAIRNPSDAVAFNYDMNHPNRGSYGPNVSMGSNGHNQTNAVLGRTLCYPLPPCDTTMQSSAVVHSSSNQRTAYRTPLTNNTQDFRVSTALPPMPPWHSRNLSIVGNDNEGIRARNQFQRFSNTGNAPDRWPYGVAAGIDEATLYSPMNYFDHHSDMRLDIDNMSYEELLALGENIGNVNTGLTEEAMSRCLLESIYCSSNRMQDDQEKENCSICLEAYEDREGLGKLKCRHEFHAFCIKKWLLLKNACPICKTSASEDM